MDISKKTPEGIHILNLDYMNGYHCYSLISHCFHLGTWHCKPSMCGGHCRIRLSECLNAGGIPVLDHNKVAVSFFAWTFPFYSAVRADSSFLFIFLTSKYFTFINNHEKCLWNVISHVLLCGKNEARRLWDLGKEIEGMKGSLTTGPVLNPLNWTSLSQYELSRLYTRLPGSAEVRNFWLWLYMRWEIKTLSLLIAASIGYLKYWYW